MKKFVVTACLILALLPVGALAQEEAGVVVSVQAGAWRVQEENTLALAIKSPVYAGDTLVTNQSGHVQIMFHDDSVLSIGPNTEVAVQDFAFDAAGGEARFATGVLKGFTRFVTGKVVEQNRAGFSVTTPHATVGIRGTTFAVNVSPDGVSSIIGLEVNPALPVTVTNLQTGAVSVIESSGMAVDASAVGNTTYATPPGQFSQSSSAVTARPVAAAAPASISGDGQAHDASVGDVSGGRAIALTEGVLLADKFTGQGPANARILTDSAGMDLRDTLASWLHTMPGPDHASTSGVYSGSLYDGSLFAGRFSFSALLSAGNGLISDAQMQLLGLGAMAGQNGSAVVSNGQFDIGLSVTDPRGEAGLSAGNDASMSGGFAGPDVSGRWNFTHDDQSEFKGGTFRGSRN